MSDAPPAERAKTLHELAVLRAPAAPEQAVALLRDALALRPDLPQAGDHLGTLLAALGRPREAIAAWRAALAEAPADADLWRRLAGLLRTTPAAQGGAPAEAVVASRHAQAAAKDAPAALAAAIQLEMGLSLLAAGKPDTAISALLRARALDAALPGIAAPLGAALLARGDAAEAVPVLRAALAERPADRASLQALARALLALRQPEPAIAALRRGLALSPGDHPLLIMLARALLAPALLAPVLLAPDVPNGSRPAAGLAALRPLLADWPAPPAPPPPAEALLVAGQALRALGRPAEALARLTAALAQMPDDPETLYEAALARLTQGDFAGGWPGFAHRLHADPHKSTETRLRQPRWTGEQPLAGQNILLYGEYELEDTLQFLRYLPMLAGLGARIQLRVPPALHPLVAAMPALADTLDIVLLAPDASPAPSDLRCALADLPAAFGTTLPTIPAVVPYLAPPAALAALWQGALPPGTPRIALCWAGRKGALPQRGETLKPAMLGALLDGLTAALPTARLHALGPEDPEATPVLDRFEHLLDLRPNTHAVEHLAAALCCMDLVLAVDGPLLHLAGALARPCFALLPEAAGWRWLVGRRDSPWYPTLRLFRGDGSADDIVRQARQVFFL
jgi:tetratricopeptide (TPR) repeat protein